jgi:hypothetical protein
MWLVRREGEVHDIHRNPRFLFGRKKSLRIDFPTDLSVGGDLRMFSPDDLDIFL